jgi:hydroxymethylglutaryl-CoA lyase
MADTAEVIRALDLRDTKTKLSVIVANKRGAEEAAQFEQINFMGYPFSISETFQVRNTNSTIEQALETVKSIQEVCINNNKEFVLYISMAFGNPYGDPWNIEVAEKWVDEMQKLDIKYLSLSDTVGVADTETITYLYTELINRFPKLEFGAHFHTHPNTWRNKIEPAYNSGCRRFDGAIKGFGGCPMAKDDLVGNMPTEHLVSFFEELGQPTGLNTEAFNRAMAMTGEVFPL